MQHPDRVASRFQYSVDTTEEYMAMARPPVADGLKDRFAVVQRPTDPNDIGEVTAGHHAITELVTVTPADEDGRERLLHMQHNHASETGWKAVEVELPTRRLGDGASLGGAVAQIASFYQNGQIHALLHYPQPGVEGRTVLPMKFLATENRWSQWDLRDDVDDEGYDIFRGDLRNALSSTRQTDVYRTPGGNHVFYGVSTAQDDEEFFLVFETVDGTWEAAAEPVPVEGSTYRIVAMRQEDDATHYTIMRFDGSDTVHCRDLVVEPGGDGDYGYYLEWSDEREVGALLHMGGLKAADVTPLPSGMGSDAVLVRSDTGALALVSGYIAGSFPNNTFLTGGRDQPAAISSISVGTDSHQRLIVFASATADDRLWILRQDHVDGDGQVVFAPWACLGNQVAIFGCPRSMLDGAELFLVRPGDRAVEHLVQSAESTIWHHAELAVAHPDTVDPQQISAHAVELLALDDFGTPVPDAAVEVFASHACTIAIGGIGHKANTLRPVKLVTDKSGRLTVKMKADSLSSPHLRIRVAANGNETDIRPDGRVGERLQGKDPRIKVETASLRKAGLIPEDASDRDGETLARMARTIGQQLAADAPAEGPKPADKAREFEMDVSDRANPRLSHNGQARWGVPETDSRTGRRLPDTTPGTASNGFVDFLGDVLNRLKHAWDEVTRFVVRIAEGAISFIIHVGDRVRTFVVDTAHGIARTFEAFFSFAADAFAKAADVARKIVNFVTALFDWEHIAVTNELLSHAFLDFLDKGQTLIRNTVAPAIDRTMRDIKANLDDILGHLEQVVAPMSITGEGIQGAPDPGGHRTKSAATAAGNGVQCRFAIAHTSNNHQAVTEHLKDVSFPADDNVQAVLSDLGKHLAKSANLNFVEGGKAVIEAFRHCKTAADVLQGGLVALIRAVKVMLGFMIDLTSELLVVAARLSAIFIGWLKSVLEIRLPIPVIDYLFNRLTGKSLRVVDLFTFGIAVPTAVVSRLLSKIGSLTRHDVSVVKTQTKDATMTGQAMPTIATAKTPPTASCAPSDSGDIRIMRIAAAILAIAKGLTEFFFKPPLLLTQHAYDSIPDEVDIPRGLAVLAFLLLSFAKIILYFFIISFSAARFFLLQAISKKQSSSAAKGDSIEAWIEKIYLFALISASAVGAIISAIGAVVNFFPKGSVHIVYAVAWIVQSFKGTSTTPVVPFDQEIEHATTLDKWKADALSQLGGSSKIAAGLMAVLNFVLDVILLLIGIAFGIWILVVNIRDGEDARGWLMDFALVLGSLYALLSFVPPLSKFLGAELVETAYGGIVLGALLAALFSADQYCPVVAGSCNIAVGIIELAQIA